VTPHQNYHNLRVILDNKLEQIKNGEEDVRPTVPYIGVTCQDLILLDELPSNIDEMINFKKLRRIHNSIEGFYRIINVPYKMKPDLELCTWFLENRRLPKDTDLFQLSYECQPRGQ